MNERKRGTDQSRYVNESVAQTVETQLVPFAGPTFQDLTARY